MPDHRILIGVPALLALHCAAPALALGGACSAESGDRVVVLVELYTSEGCNSCPPADRWLSSLTRRDDVMAAAFHVDYWDRLGWTDRFGSARHTARQAEQQQRSGAGFSYTPQVLVNGQDWRRWPSLPPPKAGALVGIALQRDGDTQVSATVTPRSGAPRQLSMWWALLEDGHSSAVKSGENAGVTLRHDHVVRRYVAPVAWSADAPRRWTLDAPRGGEAGRPVRLLVVVGDATSGAPLQALQLRC
jgi:hypothetical protein